MDTLKSPRKRSKPDGRRGRPFGTGAVKSDAVKRTRTALGLTQTAMADELHCSPSAVQRMERLSLLPGQGTLLEAFKRMARRAGVSIEEEPEA
jgi:ribosome-binding protein aMBF1 (putative translation factor)